MRNPFKRQKPKEQVREEKRINALVREQLYPVLVADCKSVYDMKRRVEAVNEAIRNNIMVRVERFKDELNSTLFKDMDVKALPGKGEEIEQKIIELLQNEPLKVVDLITTRFPQVIDSCIQVEMMEREPATLKVPLTN